MFAFKMIKVYLLIFALKVVTSFETKIHEPKLICDVVGKCKVRFTLTVFPLLNSFHSLVRQLFMCFSKMGILFQGEIIESYVIPSKDECLLLCRGEVTCQWFSYDLRQNICILLYSCPELNENFVDYISGQVNCQNPSCKYQNSENTD